MSNALDCLIIFEMLCRIYFFVFGTALSERIKKKTWEFYCAYPVIRPSLPTKRISNVASPHQDNIQYSTPERKFEYQPIGRPPLPYLPLVFKVAKFDNRR